MAERRGGLHKPSVELVGLGLVVHRHSPGKDLALYTKGEFVACWLHRNGGVGSEAAKGPEE